MFISARHASVRMDVSRDKKKDQFATSGLLFQMSSLSVVYSFRLLCVIQKYLQISPKFRGQAMKSCASSDPARSRLGNRSVAGPLLLPWPAKAQQEVQVSYPTSSELRDRRLRDFGTLPAHGVSRKPAAWPGCAKPSSGQPG